VAECRNLEEKMMLFEGHSFVQTQEMRPSPLKLTKNPSPLTYFRQFAEEQEKNKRIN